MHYIDLFYNKYYIPTLYNRLKSCKRNKNSDFSLLCANCIGGYISHQLNVPFLSPTVNLMKSQPDFYKFISNLDYYLNCEFEELAPRICPRAKLDDIIINFTHYKTYEDGVSSWNRRKKRINYDNLWIIATDRDGIKVEDIEKLGYINCQGLVCFTSKKIDLPYCFQLKQFSEKSQIGDILGKTILGKWVFEQYFDYVSWLNSPKSDVEQFRIKD